MTSNNYRIMYTLISFGVKLKYVILDKFRVNLKRVLPSGILINGILKEFFMSRKSESQFLDNLSNKLMSVNSFRDAVNRNEWFHDSLKEDSFVRDMMQFAEIGNGIYSAEDILTWRKIFSKIVLLPDGVVHTEIEMDIFNVLNEMIGGYVELMKFRYYDNVNYMDYAVSAQNQKDIKHNGEVSGKTWLWVVRYGNCRDVAANDYQNQAQFNYENGALAFNVTSFFEVSDFENYIKQAGFAIHAEANPALDLDGSGYARWVEIHSLDDIKALSSAIVFCYKKRLVDFGKMLSDAGNGF